MSVRLDEAEIREFVTKGHTGIFTSLRADGWPVSLPIWYVVLDDHVYVRTPNKSKKVVRVKNDDRVSFVVESGKAWKELKSVVITGRAVVVEDELELARVDTAVGAKYESFGIPKTVPRATKKHYGGGSTVIRIDPVKHPLTWDNAKIRLQVDSKA
jgi:nitroimidazol reductase NimA-like FMN-containing flavoprotein (pyridoxamine 5'-phosphate oxidase superfamily)